MEIENMQKLKGYYSQGRCFDCATEGIICQKPEASGVIGVWEILLNENCRMTLNISRAGKDAIEKCAKRVRILTREPVLAS